jgi:hypothetical protein
MLHFFTRFSLLSNKLAVFCPATLVLPFTSSAMDIAVTDFKPAIYPFVGSAKKRGLANAVKRIPRRHPGWLSGPCGRTLDWIYAQLSQIKPS